MSRQTVSNALNAPERVKASTLARVLSAVERAGYRPLESARALRTQRSRTLAMRLYPSTNGINGAVMDRYVHALVEAAEHLGHRVLVFTARDRRAEVEAITDLAERKAIDACVLTDTSADDSRPGDLVAAGVPVAAFGRPWGHPKSSHFWVDVDGAAGTHAAVDHLVERGCRRVGFLGWPESSGVGEDRRQGWAQAVAHHGLEADELLSMRVADSIRDGGQAAKVLLDRGVDGVICASDSLAIGALQQARWSRKLLAFGSEAPIVGFDDTPVARAIGLSSVEQPVAEVATALVRGLVAHLEGAAPAAPMLLKPRLWVRNLDVLSGPASQPPGR